MHRLIRRRLVVGSVGVADEGGETGRVHGQDANVTEDHDQAQPEEERVSRRPALAAHGRQGYMTLLRRVNDALPVRGYPARKLMRLARGAPRQIRDGADTLLAMKDVRYGQLVPATTRSG